MCFVLKYSKEEMEIIANVANQYVDEEVVGEEVIQLLYADILKVAKGPRTVGGVGQKFYSSLKKLKTIKEGIPLKRKGTIAKPKPVVEIIKTTPQNFCFYIKQIKDCWIAGEAENERLKNENRDLRNELRELREIRQAVEQYQKKHL